jgi:hypothetical protein
MQFHDSTYSSSKKHFQQNLVTSQAFSAKRKNLYFKKWISKKIQKKKYGEGKTSFFF